MRSLVHLFTREPLHSGQMCSAAVWKLTRLCFPNSGVGSQHKCACFCAGTGESSKEAYGAKHKVPLNYICRQNPSKCSFLTYPHSMEERNGEKKPLRTEQRIWNSRTTTAPGGRCIQTLL